MSLFNDLIRDLQLIDIPLKNRQFTWCSNRPQPSHSKIDRIFVSTDLSQQFSLVSLQALEVLVSDHAPLLMNCVTEPKPRRHFKIELFWLKNPQATAIIQEVWNQNSNDLSLQKFKLSCHSMHVLLREWHCQNFSDLEKQLDFSKKTLLFFDQIEERRNLEGHERKFRIMVRERAYKVACIIETRWHQRSRCKWLQAGDKNTRYFHAVASSRHRKNQVISLMHQDQVLTNEIFIRNAFRVQMENLLGVENNVMPFNPSILYPSNPNLEFLQEPFTQIEIEVAIKHLARNKASGPDGIPNEFLQTHWPIVKDWVINIVQGFYNHTVDLTTINQANIIMTPKKELPERVGDYRPISVMNVVPKLIAKLLSIRLGSVLPNLISPCQTAFVRGRQITENFNATREMLHHISSTGKSACFIKIDFTKAFDSVNWSYLKNLMLARGFLFRWVTWIEQLLSTASSRVIMNGGETDFFMHKKGLRQGDPLSPMLFDLAADVLQKMVEVINFSIQSRLSGKLKKSIIIHQYADDTVFIANSDTTTLVSLKIILRLFTSISGLGINFDKSSWIPINICPTQVPIMSAILGCSQSNFPMTYLGLPLTLTQPNQSLFLPLIEKVESRLEGWKGRFVSRGGRLLLMNSVLSSIPIYFMTAFLLPKWVLNRLDKIRRRFLWGHSETRKGVSLLNWYEVCLPKNSGGMGGANLLIRNWSLLLRWWWRLYRFPNSLWSQTARAIRSINGRLQTHRIWMIKGSFFWNQLIKMRPFFDWSTNWNVATGCDISYWFDTWIYPPMASLFAPLASNRNWSLEKAASEGLPHHNALQVSTHDNDKLLWRWSSNHEYSANSFYKVIICGGKTNWRFHFTWQLKIPPSVKVFVFLCLKGKLLTHDVLHTRGFQCELRCEICHDCSIETALHIFFRCSYAQVFWWTLSMRLGYQLLHRGSSVQEVVLRSSQACKRRVCRQTWGAFFFSAVWILWRERNSKIFEGCITDPRRAADRAVSAAILWLQNC